MKRFINSIKEGNRYQAVEIVRSEEEAQFFFIIVKKKKNTLEVVAKSDALTWETLPKRINKNAPLFLIINTPQVLTKLAHMVKGDTEALVNTVFPNINAEDFYYETAAFGACSLVSVCRKTHVDTFLKTWKASGLTVNGFSLGVSPVTTVLPLMAADTVLLPGIKIRRQGDTIEAIEKNEKEISETYTINGITLESPYLSGFSVILSAVVQNGPAPSNFSGLNAALQSDFYHQRFFHFFVRAGLGLLLLALLANFFFFNHYYREGEALREAATLRNADKARLSEAGSRVREKQERIDAILASSSSKSAFYMDKIAAALPETVLLEEIDYQPLEKPLKPGAEIRVQRNVITVSGESKEDTAFSAWLEQMEKWEVTEGITIRHYEYSGAATSLFTIYIHLKK